MRYKIVIVHLKNDISIEGFRDSDYAKGLAKEWGIEVEELIIRKFIRPDDHGFGFEITTRKT